MAKRQQPSSVGRWRPWQLRGRLTIPLTCIAFLLFITLEALVQVGQRPLRDSTMRSKWLAWYCQGKDDNNCIHLPLGIVFENGRSSQSGLLTFLLPDTVSPAATFGWLYFPTILAVVYAIFWQIVDDETKRLEPFYQAQRPQGATASSTLFASYFSIPPILVPIQAIGWRQAAVFLSSTTYILIGFITPILQSQMVQIQNQVIQVGYVDELFPNNLLPIQRGESLRSNGRQMVGLFIDDVASIHLGSSLYGLTNEAKLQNVVYLDPQYARAQEAILLLAVVTGSFLIWVQRSRRTELGPPTAGLGTLISFASTYPDFLADLAPLAEAKNAKDASAVEKHLGRRIVRFGKRCSTDSEYGFWFERPAAGTAPEEVTTSSSANGSFRTSCYSVGPFSLLRFAAWIMPTANLFFMAIILVQGGIEKQTFSLEERFSTTVSKGSPIGLAALNLVFVSVIKSLWVVIEEHIMALHTFRSLAGRQQPAFPIFAREYARTPIIGRTYRALRDGEVMLAVVTIVSLLLEVGLTCFGIAASMSQGQAFNADAAYAIHWVAFGVCVSMFFLSSLVVEGLLRRYVVVGRNPDTLGARLSYLCRSPLLLMDFGPIKAMNGKQRDTYLRLLPFLYSLYDIRYYTTSGQLVEVQGLERVHSGATDE